MATPNGSFDLFRRPPAPHLRHLVTSLCGYRETAPAPHRQRETAGLIVPLIISLGSAFRIALGREPGAADAQPSFVAGLYPGPVIIDSDGAAECIQVDFTPLGAYRCFGGAAPLLAARMVDVGALLGIEGRRLVERLGNTPCWTTRFELVEAFIAAREAFTPSREVAFAYRRLQATAGATRILTLASEIGWSRKHLAERFRAEIGLPPKPVARMLRFHQACRLARCGVARWSMIAAEAGYADQAHLVRDFAQMAGETPNAWARRLAASDPRLIRAIESGAG